ncbi:MAG: integration host factor subunit beta [Lachnospiraceae bacterium]|nr:integration host factor subunit beta [Lachnospiraceae bacterium]
MVTRADLVDRLVERADNKLYKYQIRDLVDSLFDELQEALKEGEKITIRGFGTFDTKTFKAHAAVHPKSKEAIMVPEFKRVVFRPGEELLREIRDT